MELMKKKLNKKGFTLAELLIVVAIIAVLVAIAIPIFTTQLERAKETADIANIRSAYAEAVAEALQSDDGVGSATSVEMTQATSGWAHVDAVIAGDPVAVPAVEAGNTVTVEIDPADVSAANPSGVTFTVN